MNKMKHITNLEVKAKNENDWNEWFAGLLDGDGCFFISKAKEVSVEITTHIFDVKLLAHVKDKLGGGSIKMRSGSQSVRYRVKAKPIVYEILTRVNGKLHNEKRLAKYQEACQLFQIEPIASGPLSPTSPYIAGLIDSDGTICLHVSSTKQEFSIMPGVEGRIQRLIHSRGANQIGLKIASVDKANIDFLLQTYQFGKIYCAAESPKKKRQQVQYHWTLRDPADFQTLSTILQKFPLKSVKMHRLRLVPLYFKYKEFHYHLTSVGSIEFKQWEKFCRLWYKYSY